jgi:hypothetical protein
MKTASPHLELLRRALVQPTRGVVGLVDELLKFSVEHNLQLDWQADRFLTRSGEGEWEELVDLHLRKSVFRAILARMAVLCNERAANSVSPYGGQGELSVGANPATVFRVRFANTPEEQKFELTMATQADGEVLRQSPCEAISRIAPIVDAVPRSDS